MRSSGVALLFGLVNALIGTLLRLISLPLTLMTFGLFGLVINGVLLAITAGLTDVLDVGGFLATILAAVVISSRDRRLCCSSSAGSSTSPTRPQPHRRRRSGASGPLRAPPATVSSSVSSSGSAARTASTSSTTAVPSTNANAVPPVGWSCAR